MQQRTTNAASTSEATTPAMAPAIMPIFLPLGPEPFDDPDEPDEPDAEAPPAAEPPDDEELFEDPEPPEVVLTVVTELEKLMLGVLVVELEPYTYEVVPEGGDVGSAHSTVTDSMRAWKRPPMAT